MHPVYLSLLVLLTLLFAPVPELLPLLGIVEVWPSSPDGLERHNVLARQAPGLLLWAGCDPQLICRPNDGRSRDHRLLVSNYPSYFAFVHWTDHQPRSPFQQRSGNGKVRG